MINGIENLISQASGASRKKQGGSGGSGTFEALLAILSGQYNFPGNNTATMRDAALKGMAAAGGTASCTGNIRNMTLVGDPALFPDEITVREDSIPNWFPGDENEQPTGSKCQIPGGDAGNTGINTHTISVNKAAYGNGDAIPDAPGDKHTPTEANNEKQLGKAQTADMDVHMPQMVDDGPGTAVLQHGDLYSEGHPSMKADGPGASEIASGQEMYEENASVEKDKAMANAKPRLDEVISGTPAGKQAKEAVDVQNAPVYPTAAEAEVCKTGGEYTDNAGVKRGAIQQEGALDDTASPDLSEDSMPGTEKGRQETADIKHHTGYTEQKQYAVPEPVEGKPSHIPEQKQELQETGQRRQNADPYSGQGQDASVQSDEEGNKTQTPAHPDKKASIQSGSSQKQQNNEDMDAGNIHGRDESRHISQDAYHAPSEIKADKADMGRSVNADVKQPVYNGKDNVLSQIYDRIKVVNTDELSELHVKLKPRELGEVTIKLVMEKGVMTGRIIVENSQIKSLIDSSMPELKEQFKNQNLNLSEINVFVGTQTGDTYYGQNFSGNRWAYNRKHYSNFQASISMDEGTLNAENSISAVDLLV